MRDGTRLILVRHAETASNREMRYVGSRDDALSYGGLALPGRPLALGPRRVARFHHGTNALFTTLPPQCCGRRAAGDPIETGRSTCGV